MFNSNGGYSLADISAATGNGNGGFFGNEGIWAVIILAIIFGWGNGNGGLFGGYGGGSGVTDGYILTSDFANIERKIDGVNNGICSLGYDQLAQMNAINQNVSTTGYAIQNAIQADTIANMQNTNAIATQLADCCCENRVTALQAQNQAATEACATRQAVADSTATIVQAIRDMQTSAMQDKIAELTAMNSDLRFQASQAAQSSYLVNHLVSQLRPSPQPAYVVPNPYGCNCGYNNTFYGYNGTTVV